MGGIGIEPRFNTGLALPQSLMRGSFLVQSTGRTGRVTIKRSNFSLGSDGVNLLNDQSADEAEPRDKSAVVPGGRAEARDRVEVFHRVAEASLYVSQSEVVHRQEGDTCSPQRVAVCVRAWNLRRFLTLETRSMRVVDERIGREWLQSCAARMQSV
jgi:hypothetical protein